MLPRRLSKEEADEVLTALKEREVVSETPTPQNSHFDAEPTPCQTIAELADELAKAGEIPF